MNYFSGELSDRSASSADGRPLSPGEVAALIDTRAFVAEDWKVSAGVPQSGLTYTWSDGLPVIRADHKTFTSLAKRSLDIFASGLALLLLFPLLLATAIMIKITSPGPVLFRQIRTGLNGTTFEILKFRTMRIDVCDASGVAQTLADDDRLTSIGLFLRTKSIDELPQLINVLRGEMSLVGPRPHVPGMLAAGVTYETLVPYYPLRHASKPGLTGWAQVNGYRGPTSSATRARGRVDHDLAYIQNFSLWLDIRIILLTVVREVFRGTGS